MGGLRGKALGASAALAAIAAIALPAPAGAVSAADTCRAQDDQILVKADVKLAERSLLCLVNVHRVAEGARPLPWDPNLADSARRHSKDMVERGFYDHINPDGEDPTARATKAGYAGDVVENIYERRLATGVSPLQFFLGWEGVRANDQVMLSNANQVAGIGFALGTHTGDAGVTATQAFGLRKSSATYTALDMLVPAECPPARAALKKAQDKLDAAKISGKGVAKAKRAVKKRKAAVRRACKPNRF